MFNDFLDENDDPENYGTDSDDTETPDLIHAPFFVPGFLQQELEAILDNNLARLKELINENNQILQEEGHTLLEQALKCDLIGIFDYLLSFDNININTPNEENGSTALMTSVCTVSSRHFVKKLLEKGADPDAINFQGLTSLHLALKYGKAELSHLLIEHGADIDVCDDDGNSTLYYACKGEDSECIHMLLYYNVNINAESLGNLYLHVIRDCRRDDKPIILDYILDEHSDLVCDLGLLTAFTQIQLPRLVSNLLLLATTMEYSYWDFAAFGTTLISMNTDNLRTLLRRFPDVIDDFVDSCDVINVILNFLQSESLEYDETYCIHTTLDNLNLLLDYGYGPKLIEMYSLISPPLNKLSELGLAELTQLMYTLLSYGFTFTVVDLYNLYDRHGYCTLFQFLLHVDYDEDFKVSNLRLQQQGSSVMACLICDMTMSIDQFAALDDIDVFDDQFFQLFDHTAHPRLRKLALESTNLLLAERVQRLPTVPSLLELARNASRQEIIKSYDIKKSVQYYTLIKYLGLPSVCVKMLSFQRALYPKDPLHF